MKNLEFAYSFQSCFRLFKYEPQFIGERHYDVGIIFFIWCHWRTVFFSSSINRSPVWISGFICWSLRLKSLDHFRQCSGHHRRVAGTGLAFVYQLLHHIPGSIGSFGWHCRHAIFCILRSHGPKGKNQKRRKHRQPPISRILLLHQNHAQLLLKEFNQSESWKSSFDEVCISCQLMAHPLCYFCLMFKFPALFKSPYSWALLICNFIKGYKIPKKFISWDFY